jgi:aminoglycoside phosphotransferase family enzyme/predicted kinase
MSTAIIAPTTQSLVEFLQDPTSYPDRPGHVDTIETHISWVFLTHHHAYKLKKPVQYGFLDFSNAHARRLACAEEIRLNRRLSHNVYLSMLPITFDQGRGLELDGCGDEIDFVVKMRRLPSDLALDQLIQHQKVRNAGISDISECLIDFYTSLPPVVLQPRDHYQRLVDHCEANLSDLLDYRGETQELQVRRIHGAQKRYLTLEKELFYNRVRDGRIVDGHGDLRAEHIYLESPPAIIDCVEFSKELREVDVLDDLSFLAMDCQRLGNGDIGKRLFEAYQQASGDNAPNALVAFYKSYRACVRAKVAALRAEHADESSKKRLERQIHQYLNWADHYAARLGPPILVVTGGLMGSGKSTLATQIAEAIGAELISTDQLRRSLFGSSESLSTYGTGVYRSDLRIRVYEELLSRAGSVLDDGRSVVLDGTFLTNALRRTALEQGKRHGTHGLFVECVCPKETALERIAERTEIGTTVSEARPELYNQQLKERESLDSAIPAVCVDTTASFNEELKTVFSALRTDLFVT